MARQEHHPEDKRKDKDPNEGEGNKTYAKKYNREATGFEGRDEAARKAKEAVESDEDEELEAAEREGKRHIAEEDPEVRGED